MERAFDRLLELEPLYATRVGAHQHDHRLPGGGRADVEAQMESWRTLQRELEGADDLDADVARYVAGCFLLNLEELRFWERMSDAADTLGTAVFLVFAREHAPLDERLEAITARLEDAPRYLRASRELLTRPVRLWNEVALEAARSLPGLFETIAQAPALQSLRSRLDRALAAATSAAEEHARWLEHEVIPAADPNSSIGEEAFQHVLERRLLPGTADSILALGRDYLAQLKAERAELVAREWPGRDDAQELARIRADRAADFETSLAEYRNTMSAAREFVRDRRLATIPDNEQLLVLATPEFMQPLTPFAAYEPPAFFDEVQLGLYYVTPPSDEEGLGEQNRSAIVNTSFHEAYPGHHLQFACANSNRSLARVMSGFLADEFVEGWAHYCEQLMFEEGFNQTPELRLVQLNDLIWRACRVILDVELSRGRMTPEQGVEMLATEARMDRDRARAEVYRYTFTPGYQLSYLYGRHLILQLRRRIQAKYGAAFDLGKFHDTLLYNASLPAAVWDRLF